MSTDIYSDSVITDPSSLIPYAENDEAIVRGVTKGLIDFSNPLSYAGSGALPVGTKIKSLTVDAGQATVAGAGYPAVVNGMLDQSFATLNGDGPRVELPDTFKLLPTCKKFAVVVYAKLPSSGYVLDGNSTGALMGYMINTSTNCQYGIGYNWSPSTGNAGSLQTYAPGAVAAGAAATLLLTSAADLAAVFDGNLHQIVLAWDAQTVDGQATHSIYVDKVLRASSTRTYDKGVIQQPGGTSARLGFATAFQSKAPAGLKVGRPSLWDLTGSALSFADLMARDWDEAQGYLS